MTQSSILSLTAVALTVLVGSSKKLLTVGTAAEPNRACEMRRAAS